MFFNGDDNLRLSAVGCDLYSEDRDGTKMAEEELIRVEMNFNEGNCCRWFVNLSKLKYSFCFKHLNSNKKTFAKQQEYVSSFTDMHPFALVLLLTGRDKTS